MRFTAGVIVGTLVGRTVLNRITRPVRPGIEQYLLKTAARVAESFSDILNNYLEEQENQK